MLPPASCLEGGPVRTSVAARAGVSWQGSRSPSRGLVLWFALFGWAALGLALAMPALAAPYAVNLEYKAGPDCPDASDFAATVQARLGYDPFSDVAPEKVLVL